MDGVSSIFRTVDREATDDADDGDDWSNVEVAADPLLVGVPGVE